MGAVHLPKMSATNQRNASREDLDVLMSMVDHAIERIFGNLSSDSRTVGVCRRKHPNGMLHVCCVMSTASYSTSPKETIVFPAVNLEPSTSLR